MYLIFFCLILFLVDSTTAGGRILNGYPIDIEQAPYTAHIHIIIGGGYGSCGGSIISRSFILTAGHCK